MSWAYRDNLVTGNDNVISLTDWLKNKETATAVASEAPALMAA